jgi:molecular chaperone DnaK (HSP70)
MNLLEKLRTAAASAKPGTRVIGIDLGTTNSTVAQVRLPLPESSSAEFACECVPLEQATQMSPFTGALIPSVVAIDKAGMVWIGEGAKRMRAEPQKHGLSLEKNLFYETKNDMGLQKRYHRAAEDFDHASKIAGHLLRFMVNGARQATGSPPGRTVVTVPASFQINQREDTIAAAKLAGLSLANYDLLDEPVAALTDYLFTCAGAEVWDKPQNTVVFDFGGGTCDVFVARLSPADNGSAFSIETRSVSRYHRLGGGDFDTAIIHNVLIPQLLKENELAPRHFEWTDRKKIIEPALRGCAEALKEGLCREISQLHLHGRYEAADKSRIVARQAPTKVSVGGKDYLLAHPELSAAQWEEILKPFLDLEMMHARETDYVLALSVFAPITDALERAKLRTKDVDLVLLAGGSSLVPQVQWAVEKFFPQSRVLRFPDSTAAQTAIARGAAWTAAWLEAFKKPLVNPVISQTIALRVQGRDPIPLVTAGTAIPFPADGEWKTVAGLALPKKFTGTLRIEAITLPEEHVVLNLSVPIDASEAGEALNLEFRFGSSHSFECAVALRKRPDDRIVVEAENPLINVSNPGAVRVEIEQIEEDLRDAGGFSARHRDKLMRLAELYRELRMTEKAVDILKGASRAVGSPDAEILNRLAMFYDEIGDLNRMEAHYAEAARVSGKWAGPLFNWALHLFRRRNFALALEKVDEGILREPDSGPYYILRARILDGMGQSVAAKEAAQQGIGHFPPLSAQSPWHLGWYENGAATLGREADVKAARLQRERKGVQPKGSRTGENELPVVSQS